MGVTAADDLQVVKQKHLNELEVWLDTRSDVEDFILDLKPISELTYLEYLSLNTCTVEDFSALAELKKLKGLILFRCNITDLSPVTNLKSLQLLKLVDTRISDLTPLIGLKNLKELNLQDTSVTKQQIDDLQKSLPMCKITHDFD